MITLHCKGLQCKGPDRKGEKRGRLEDVNELTYVLAIVWTTCFRLYPSRAKMDAASGVFCAIAKNILIIKKI